MSSKQSTNLASINSTQLKAFPVPCPDLQEQRVICSIMGSSDGRLDAEQTQLSKLHSLKRGRAHDLLTGRVRVRA